MDAFAGLSEEKQDRIMNAAFLSFGANGYKKASVNDIATAAGISKAMVFHYFGTKKDLYCFLGKYCMDFMAASFQEALPEILDPKNSDFFDRIYISTRIKVSLMKKYPAILIFVKSMFFEQELEVRPMINQLLGQGDILRGQMALGGIDVFKFKEGVEPEKLMQMLKWMTEGYMGEFPTKEQYDIDKLVKEFEDCMKMMKNNFYKEEYL